MLSISHLKCLQDEPISIEIKNLDPGAEVTLTSSIKDSEGRKYYTYTHYGADINGKVNLSRNPSLGGTWSGFFPMGFITGFKPDPNAFHYGRYINRDASPMLVKFLLLKGHVDEKMAFHPDEDLILDSVDHERIFWTENTQRIPVREGRIRGTLFLPEGEGPFPGIIDLFGGISGIIEFRSAQFAARGIASLILAYFDYEDLPKEPKEYEVSYFEEAVQYLLKNDKIKKNGIGILGLSRGAQMALLAGTFIPEVKAVVSINGLAVVQGVPFKTRDRTIPIISTRKNLSKVVKPGLATIYGFVSDSIENYPESHIPIQDADAEFLFVCGEDDLSNDIVKEAERCAEVLKSHGKSNYQILKYPGTGHLFEPPFAPFARSSITKLLNLNILWGGNALQHTEAEVDSWNKILEFFNRVLS